MSKGQEQNLHKTQKASFGRTSRERERELVNVSNVNRERLCAPDPPDIDTLIVDVTCACLCLARQDKQTLLST